MASDYVQQFPADKELIQQIFVDVETISIMAPDGFESTSITF